MIIYNKTKQFDVYGDIISTDLESTCLSTHTFLGYDVAHDVEIDEDGYYDEDDNYISDDTEYLSSECVTLGVISNGRVDKNIFKRDGDMIRSLRDSEEFGGDKVVYVDFKAKKRL